MDTKDKKTNQSAPRSDGRNKQTKSVYAAKKKDAAKGRARGNRSTGPKKEKDEFDQRLVDIARVTRVMAGGKRMRFRACVVVGNRKGKIGVGVDKGADVTIAVNKAVNQAKKNIMEVPLVNDTIPHEIYYKFGAAKILLKPARRGKGVIAGGAARTVLEMAGVKNVTSKILGTNNKMNIVKGAIHALDNLKKVENHKKKKPEDKKTGGNEKDKQPAADKA